MTIRVRALSPGEVGQLTELAHSRKRGAGLVRRAQIIMRAVEERVERTGDCRPDGAVR